MGRGGQGLGVRGSLHDVLLWIGDPCRQPQTQTRARTHTHTPDFKDAPGEWWVDEWVGEGAGKRGGGASVSRYSDGQSKEKTKKTAGDRLFVVDESGGSEVRDDFVLERERKKERERERKERETPSTRCHSPHEIMGSQKGEGGRVAGGGEGGRRIWISTRYQR